MSDVGEWDVEIEEDDADTVIEKDCDNEYMLDSEGSDYWLS